MSGCKTKYPQNSTIRLGIVSDTQNVILGYSGFSELHKNFESARNRNSVICLVWLRSGNIYIYWLLSELTSMGLFTERFLVPTDVMLCVDGLS